MDKDEEFEAIKAEIAKYSDFALINMLIVVGKLLVKRKMWERKYYTNTLLSIKDKYLDILGGRIEDANKDSEDV